MTYDFACDVCREHREVVRSMTQASDPAFCTVCGGQMTRLYASFFHCDEIRSTKYIDPNLRKEVTGHGKYFDIGGGFWVHSKGERRREMEKRGLREHGPRMV